MSRTRWLYVRVMISTAIALVAYLVWGYSYGILTNEYHSTIALRLSGGATFQGDAMSSTLDGYASPLWKFVGWLVRGIPVRTVFFGGFILSRILFAWAIGSLASAFAGGGLRGRGAWTVGAVATFAIGWILPLPVGGDPVLGPYFSQTFLSVGLVSLSIAAAIRRDIFVSAALLGCAIDCNIMQSFFGAGIVGLLWLDAVCLTEWSSLRRIGLAILAATLFALPGLVLTVHSMAASSAGEVPWVGQQLSDWARFWLAGHFFPDGRDWMRQLSMASLLATPVMLLAGLSFPSRRLRPWAVAAFLFPAILAVAEILAVGRFPCRLLFQFHFFRSDVFAYCVTVGLAIAVAVESFRKGMPEAILPMAIVASSLGGNHLAAFLLASVLLVAMYPASRFRSVPLVAVSCMTAALSAWSLANGNRAGGIVCAIGLLGAFLPGREGYRRSLSLAMIVLVLAVFGQSTFAFWRKEWTGKNFAAKFGEDQPIARQLKSFGRSSPREAVFLLPPSVNARPYLERGVWFNFYDGAAFLWRPGAEADVLRRMRILGIHYEAGHMVDLDSMDAQWYAGLCRSIPIAAAEGVTEVVLPDPKNPQAPWTMLDPASARKFLGCSVAR